MTLSALGQQASASSAIQRAPPAVEAVSRLGVGPAVDALAYAADARPVDAHELGRGGFGGLAGEPGDLLLELAREARCVLGPGHGCDDDPVLGALDPDRGVLDEGHHGALVHRPPPPGGWRAVVDGAVPVAVGADVVLVLARAAGGDHGAVALLPDGFDDSGAEAQRFFEYSFVLHGGGLPGPLPGPLREVDFVNTKTSPAALCTYLGLFICPIFGSDPQKPPKPQFSCPCVPLGREFELCLSDSRRNPSPSGLPAAAAPPARHEIPRGRKERARAFSLGQSRGKKRLPWAAAWQLCHRGATRTREGDGNRAKSVALGAPRGEIRRPWAISWQVRADCPHPHLAFRYHVAHED